MAGVSAESGEQLLGGEVDETLSEVVVNAESVFIKKLPSNDRDWAEYASKHKKA